MTMEGLGQPLSPLYEVKETRQRVSGTGAILVFE